MFHFNTIVREGYRYFNPLTGGTEPISEPELLNDFDSTAECFIIKSYLEKRNMEATQEKICQLSLDITSALNSGKSFSDSLENFRKNTRLIKDRNAFKVKQKGDKPSGKTIHCQKKIHINLI